MTGATDVSRARLAIDLGASNVKIAWFEHARIVDSSERRIALPAVVAVRAGVLLVGQDALAVSATDPSAALIDVREWLGYVPSVRLAGTEVRVDEAVTALYRAAAEATVGTTDQVPAVVVHPAGWPERRVQLLTAAAEDAGLDVVLVVPDAVAVAATGPATGDVLVIDVGAALTVSVVRTGGGRPEILWTGSSAGAGGEAIAHAIRAVTNLPVGRARQLARGAQLDTEEIPLDWTAVRSEADDAHAAARELINEVLRGAQRDGGDIARVYITGGASVAPFIREAVEHRFRNDRTEKVAELAGPAAGAAYGALRMCRPQNIWPATPGRERRPPHDHEPAPAPAPAPLTNEWSRPGPEPERVSTSTSTPAPQVAAAANSWPAQPIGRPPEPAAAPNAWRPAASGTGVAPSAASPPAPTAASPPAPSAPSGGPAGRAAGTRRRKLAIILIAFVLIVLAIACALALGVFDDGSGDPPTGMAATAADEPGTRAEGLRPT